MTFFQVGLAQCDVVSQATAHLKHPSVQDSLMKGNGVQALRVLSLLLGGGVGRPLGRDFTLTDSLQLWLLRFNVQSLECTEIVPGRNGLHATLKLYSVSCTGLGMDFFNES